MIYKQRQKAITKKLLHWYNENKRDLPWRHAADPYAVWISEIMAQQTRITALLPYYRRFMARFPTVEALADAHEDDVLKAWEGLGYYSRARNLRKAARRIVDDFSGQLPDTRKELRSLPGIGEYTANAILSIAFGQAAPAVDGNVLRVFARLENSSADVSAPQTKTLAAAFVGEIMPQMPAERGHFTQALMELGALVCVPKNPLCGECPLQAECRACALGRQRELPVKSPKRAQKVLCKTVLVLQNQHGAILMRKRDEALLRGLWEFCMADGQLSPEEVPGFTQSLGLDVRTVQPLGEAKHVFTHLIWQMVGYRCQASGEACPLGYVWVDASKIGDLAMPTALRTYREQI